MSEPATQLPDDRSTVDDWVNRMTIPVPRRRVRVRAAVVIDDQGNYGVCGWRPEESWDRREADRRMMDEAEMIGEFEDEGRIVVRGWLEGEFVMPETQTVEGDVTSSVEQGTGDEERQTGDE